MSSANQPTQKPEPKAREAELHGLIDRTSGPQPWRRVFHLTSGVAVAILLQRGYVPEGWATVALAGVLALMVALDFIRLRFPHINRRFFVVFSRLASPREARGIASSTWYVTGLLLTVLLFPLEIAVPAILVLAVADPLASYLGRRWGRRALGSGSVEGSLIFLIASFLILSFFAELPVAAGVALFTTVVEPIPWRLDDNLTVPVAAGVGLLIAGILV